MRSVYEVDRDAHWSRSGTCGQDPDLFFATVKPRVGMRFDPEAAHICRNHCPVLAQCKAHAESLDPHRRVGMVLGGMAYDAGGWPATFTMLAVATSCWRCRGR